MLKGKLHNRHWLHLWKFDSSEVPIDPNLVLPILSEDEIERTKKFINKSDSERYLRAHYFLRKVLAKYLKIDARDIKFSGRLNNKPFISNVSAYPLFFNLSYSDTLFLMGVSNYSIMGVDIEKTKNIEDISLFCENYFSLKECEKIRAENSRLNQLSLLFTFWTMKESVIKALGAGFWKPLPAYDLHSFLDSKVYIPNFDPDNSWTIQLIKIKDGYKAAFAMQTNKVDIETFEYDDY